MDEYAHMTKAALIARLKRLEAKDAGSHTIPASRPARHPPAHTALSDSEERLRAILETAVEGIITIDEQGLIESVNGAAERLFGYRAAELLGQNISRLIPSPYRKAHGTDIRNYLRTGRKKIIGIGREVLGLRKDGTAFPIDLSVSEVHLVERRLFTGFIRDITERKRIEAQLKLLSEALESAANGIAITDAQGTILWVNPAFCRLTGYDRPEVTGQHTRILKSGKHSPELYRDLWETIMRGEPWHGEMVNRRKDGSFYPEEMTITPVRAGTDRITHFVAVKQDITERKRAEEERQRLEKEILEISDREQRRIGQDLHDGLCQQLAGIELMSQALQQKIASRSKADAARAGEIAAHVRAAIRQTRLLARGLFPMTLESEGLMSALRELASNTEKIFNVRCRFECAPPVLVSRQTAATHLFRIAQEAVSNALKYSKATQIRVTLTQQQGTITLAVSDNGVGFPSPLPRQKGMGLRIMESRAGMIGGALTMENNPTGGARIACEVRWRRPGEKRSNRGR